MAGSASRPWDSERSCSACGRFVCALCDVELNGRHMCPACFEKGKTNRKIKSLENQRTCYDTLALLVATVSILIYWFTIFTAPFVIYLTVRHWNSPSSIIPRTKIRFVLAFLIASLQIAGWVLVFFNLFLWHLRIITNNSKSYMKNAFLFSELFPDLRYID